LSALLSQERNWLDASGPDSDTVLSTRVRLARNLEAFPFTTRARDDELEAVMQRVAGAAQKVDLLHAAPFFRIPELSAMDRAFLVERHLASRDLVGDSRPRGIVVGPGEGLTMMINEEDHVRMQGILSGFQLEEAWHLVNRVDDDLDGLLEFAFSEDLGFLTSCPTNVGTGMRASVLVHLPSLVLTKKIRKVLSGATEVGLAVRGFYGEGTDVMGNFFQISNQVTLGEDEKKTLQSLERVARQILGYEEKARETLVSTARVQIEDKIYRALGAMQSARVISSQEVLGLISAVRFGISLGLPGMPGLTVLNRILVTSQPAHLQVLASRDMERAERNVYRAEYIRRLLAAESGAGGTDHA
jgi:protein arginine kinase